MGTIGDLLGGLDLSAFSTQDTPHGSDGKTAAENTRETHSSGKDHADESAPRDEVGASQVADTPHAGEANAATPSEIAMQAVLDETGLDPAAARAHLDLREDLDLDDLSLYAIVTVIERALKRSFPDHEVRSWHTLGDLLAAAEAH